MGPLFMVLMFFTALFLIALVLVQRGRGGGLAGALGGMGGQSAFGAKAGDVFTKITSIVAVFWILLCVGAVTYFGKTRDSFDESLGGARVQERQEAAAPAEPATGRREAEGSPRSPGAGTRGSAPGAAGGEPSRAASDKAEAEPQNTRGRGAEGAEE